VGQKAADTMNVNVWRLVALNPTADAAMTAVGFEPRQLSLATWEGRPCFLFAEAECTIGGQLGNLCNGSPARGEVLSYENDCWGQDFGDR